MTLVRSPHAYRVRNASRYARRVEPVVTPCGARQKLVERVEHARPRALPGPARTRGAESRDPFKTIFEQRLDRAHEHVSAFREALPDLMAQLPTASHDLRLLADEAREHIGWVVQDLDAHWLCQGRDPNVGSERLEQMLYATQATILRVHINMTAANMRGRAFADALLEQTYGWLDRQFGHPGIGGHVSHETTTTYKVVMPEHRSLAWVKAHFVSAIADIMHHTADGALAEHADFKLRLMVGHGWMESAGARHAKESLDERRRQERDTRQAIEAGLRMLAASTTDCERRWRGGSASALGFCPIKAPLNVVDPLRYRWGGLFAKSDGYIPKQRFIQSRDRGAMTEEERVVDDLRRYPRPLHTWEWLHRANDSGGALDLYNWLTQCIAAASSEEVFLRGLYKRHIPVTDVIGLFNAVPQVFYLAERAGRDRRLPDCFSLATPHQYKTFVAKLQRERVSFLGVIDIDHWQAFTKAHPGGDDDRYYHELVLCVRDALMEYGVVPVIALQGDTIVVGLRAADGESPLSAVQVRLALHYAQYRVYRHFHRTALHFQYEAKVGAGNGRYPAWGSMESYVPALAAPPDAAPVRGPVTISAGYMVVDPESWGDAAPRSPHVANVQRLVDAIDARVSDAKTASGLRKGVLLDVNTTLSE